ncbi:SARP family transcriptional regulator [Actinoplanes ianthinogenes]|uniref:SARP family transcriptional regulator n=1 Tax=Actinoplanes ianthinogenes TaxID=122358 RepID=A0ABN6CUF9_9ACTN|nr:BTAD domain-containing putative transcriptional regulator [Actinoplanes ianthinogenes]BCJ48434.1 SARP family transcriptional regulator [Actinoplanes ianthinogenes]GGR46410.1 SARP family transcriptional regulator [Actinoplanes ianthinogenes]
MDRLRITLFGGLRVSRGDTDRTVAGSRLKTLLVRLALAAGHPVAPGTLIGAIWPETPPGDPAHALQALVSRLRRTLGAAGDVTRTDGGYRLAVDPADVDVLRFERLAAAGRRRWHAGDPRGAAAALGEALRLWSERPGSEPDTVAMAAPAVATRLTQLSLEVAADLAEIERALDGEGLPVPMTSFVGRDDDLDRIGRLLSTGRLVTVVGPGGAGKTRLAVEAAHRLRQGYRDGAWLVDLTSTTEPVKLGTAVLAAIGLRGPAVFEARPRAATGDLDLLVERLGGRESLLVVDNCEHLVDAVAALVEGLLTRCPRVRVLATSREPLAIGGEALVPLGPLGLPDPGADVDEARRAAAVRLFLERAVAVRPEFALDRKTAPGIVRVVRSLDGLPLALELAAARLRTVSPDELADRWDPLGGDDDGPARHRTLRAVIEWSWQLLSDDERTVAERIAVLPGGVTAASATAVCAGAGVPPAEVPQVLASLVDRSLVQLVSGSDRYRMLETIREYAVGRTADPGAVRDLAADYVTGLMDRCDPRLRGPGQLAAMRVITAEYDNALAALRRRCDTGDRAGAVRLALRLCWYWHLLGRDQDATYWLGAALAVPGGEPTPERACAEAMHLLHRAATSDAADRARMRELADLLVASPELPSPFRVFGPVLLAFLDEDAAALAIFEHLAGGGDPWPAGLARLFQAQIAENVGDLDRMRAAVDAALACFRRAGDRWGQAAALPMRAQLRQYDGDLDGVLADLRDARKLAAEFGTVGLGDQVYSDLRWIDLHVRRGEAGLAAATIEAARDRAARAASAEMLVLLDTREAEFRLWSGDLDRARELLDDADRGLPAATGLSGNHARTLVGSVRASLRLEQGDLRGAEEALREAYAAGVAARDLPILAVVAIGGAGLAQARGRQHEAAVLLGVAARLRGAHDRSDPRGVAIAARARAALGEDDFGTAYAKGWNLSAQNAVTRLRTSHT